ncbi:hypothetical protein [Halomonas tibetensis]|uniref:DUF4375 domain-containing protein n=1 Tax=Halomonas tibetensis TaxID=2259590 RepID=A0ABV7B8H8_9GAMM
MDIESAKEVVQILFWVGALILAFLTYKNARKTLLSPVNTEYQKRIFDSLNKISNRLFSELKMGEDHHWIKQRPMEDALGEICKEWEGNKASVEEFGLELTDWPAAKDWYDFHSFADEVRYELFLPDSLRKKIISYMEERAESAQYAHNHAVQKFINQVNENRSYHDLHVNNFIDIENFYIDGMDEMNMSIDKIYQRNEELMGEIVKYVQSFDPMAHF